MPFRVLALVVFLLPLLAAQTPRWSGLKELNPPPSPPAGRTVAIVGATLLDGRGGAVLPDSVVVVRGDRITAVGSRGDIAIPAGAERVAANGKFLLPGMFDAHFHTNDPQALDRVLGAGFTSIRDPGRPMAAYLGRLMKPERTLPRTFLTGPHFDQIPHAHPHNAVDLQSEQAVRDEVDRLIGVGASAIKIYYRVPLDLIGVACEQADRHGVPVTAHLELVPADLAIRAGLDGIEHVTSFGTTLAAEADAREFERRVDAENHAREDGRYWLWSRIDLDDNPRVPALIDLLVERGTYHTPTLRPFAVAPGGKNVTAEKLAGFTKMQRFTKMAFDAGVPTLASSHGPTPDGNWHEFELLVESGLTPKQALETAMLSAARFFGVDERLGSVEAGKTADLVLIGADPTADIRNVRKVERVMLNGVWTK